MNDLPCCKDENISQETTTNLAPNSALKTELSSTLKCTNDKQLPPLPERAQEVHIPKAYTLGYDNIVFEEDTVYGSQSYLHEDMHMDSPKIHAPSIDSNTLELSTGFEEAESLATNGPISIPEKPTTEPPPIPEESFADMSIDELIGLAPTQEENTTSTENIASVGLFQKMGHSISKVKDQTSFMFNKIVHPNFVAEGDLLGMDEATEVSASVYPSEAAIDFVDDSHANKDNTDIDDVFGVVLLGNTGYGDEENSDDECVSEGESYRGKSNYSILLHILCMSKQITVEEKALIKEKAKEEKKDVERIIRNYLESGESIEFCRLVRRSDDSLSKRELLTKVIKDSGERKLEIPHLLSITLCIPKVFVYNNNFFFQVELRQGKLRIINKWTPCIIRLMSHQIRVYSSVTDIPQEKTLQRMNLHALMKLGSIMKKSYRNSLYYYIKLYENDLFNFRVIEDNPDRFRNDLSAIQVLKVGSKDDLVLKVLAYQINIRLQCISKAEKVE